MFATEVLASVFNEEMWKGKGRERGRRKGEGKGKGKGIPRLMFVVDVTKSSGFSVYHPYRVVPNPMKHLICLMEHHLDVYTKSIIPSFDVCTTRLSVRSFILFIGSRKRKGREGLSSCL